MAAPAARIVILGGGFGGVYTALHLERRLAARGDVEITLVNRDNFFLFTPMLHEVAAGDLDLTHSVSPVRALLRRTRFFEGEIEGVDLDARRVQVSHGTTHHHHELEYDHLVLALGSVTNFFGLPGLAERALTMKSLGDAIHLRNRMIQFLEQADFECLAEERERLLTLVVAGGGFAGVETAAAMHDFLAAAVTQYGTLSPSDLRTVLVHAGPALLPELGPSLGRYAERQLAVRGLEVRTGVRVAGVEGETIRLSDGSEIRAGTLVWTAGTSPHPLLAALSCEKSQGRIRVEPTLEVRGREGLWALGDCAWIPAPDGTPYPPTAQHALRQAKVLAENLAAALAGSGRRRPFVFRSLGLLASLGRRAGVARILGVNFSGFAAWWLWRTIYLLKLPRFEKKLRVVLDWSLDLVFPRDLVQFLTLRSGGEDHAPRSRPDGSPGETGDPGRPAAAKSENLAELPPALRHS